jgi:hypothetical protein
MIREQGRAAAVLVVNEITAEKVVARNAQAEAGATKS